MVPRGGAETKFVSQDRGILTIIHHFDPFNNRNKQKSTFGIEYMHIISKLSGVHQRVTHNMVPPGVNCWIIRPR